MWETGYWRTMDIAHDRAGYYLCWGCLNWVPGVYTSQSLYLTNHPNTLSSGFAVGTILVGALMIYINWEADVQRQTFRDTAGKCRIWGKEPQMLIAKYRTGMTPSLFSCHRFMHACCVLLGTASSDAANLSHVCTTLLCVSV